MWLRTVLGLMTSESAISWFALPSASSAEDLQLAVGQLRAGQLPHARRADVADVLEQQRGHARRDQRLAGRRRLDAGHDLLDRPVLEDVAARAGEDRAR